MVESTKTLGEAMWQIVVADVSMSLDNVLAVAGAARDHPYIMAAGLALSIVLMGAAATFIARLLDRYRWLAWIGLVVIVYVAVQHDLGRRRADRGSDRLPRRCRRTQYACI